jgi:hypothetical protein
LLLNDHIMKPVTTYPKTENCPSSNDIPPKPDYIKERNILTLILILYTLFG